MAGPGRYGCGLVGMTGAWWRCLGSGGYGWGLVGMAGA